MSNQASAERELSVDERIKRAKKYGRAHGFEGRAGGWIYDSDGRPIVQGWWAFWNKYRRKIQAATNESN